MRAKGQKNVVKITAEAGKSPITVNAAAGTAKNLSADRLDGMDSTAFLAATARAADSDKLDGMDSTAFLGATAKATNADKLDGMDSTAFLGVGSQAADSDAVDGYDANGLLRVAFDASNDLPDGDDTGTFTAGAGSPMSASITAPTAGWLVITGTIDGVNQTADDLYNCILRVDGSSVTGTLMGSRLDGAGTTNTSENCTTHGVQEVAAGTYTVTFDLFGVATTTVFGDGSLSALFVSFDGTGGTSGL